MKFKLISLLLVLGLWNCNASNFRSVDADEFEKIISDRQNVICLDVRTAQEYNEEHIAYSLNIDVKSDKFEDRACMALSKDKTIAVYCRSGNRSKVAAEILSDKGYNVVELNNGYMDWKESQKKCTSEGMDAFYANDGTEIVFHAIKHGTMSIHIADKWIYVDPVTVGASPDTDYSGMPKADLILITHNHYDHFDTVAISQLSKEGTEIITNSETGKDVAGKCKIVANGESMTIFDKWTLDAVPAYNTSDEKLKFHPKGRDNGYVLTVDNIRIYIAGDTEVIEEMKDLKDIDIAFMPCNLPFTMTPEQLAEAAMIVNPKVLFPYHYGDTKIEEVLTLLDGTGIDVRIRQYQ